MSFETILTSNRSRLAGIAGVYDPAVCLAGAGTLRYAGSGVGFSAVASMNVSSANNAYNGILDSIFVAVQSPVNDMNIGPFADLGIHEQLLHGELSEVIPAGLITYDRGAKGGLFSRRKSHRKSTVNEPRTRSLTMGEVFGTDDSNPAHAITYATLTRVMPIALSHIDGAGRPGNRVSVSIVGPQDVVEELHGSVSEELHYGNSKQARKFAGFVLSEFMQYPVSPGRGGTFPDYTMWPPVTYLQDSVISEGADPHSGSVHPVNNQ